MKYLVTLLMLFLTSNVFAQFNIAPHTHRVELGDDIVIEYNADYQQPVRAIYEITCPNGTESRSGMDFYVPKDINFHTSDDDDYSNNIWDKGHLAPAAAFSCTEEELKTRRGWGHSSYEEAMTVAEQAGVKQLIITHHDPNHDDEFLHAREKECQARFPNCLLARDGMELEV